MIDFLVDGNDPASGFAVAQFIVVKGCPGNLPKHVPHPPRTQTEKNRAHTERGFLQEASLNDLAATRGLFVSL